MTRSSIRHSSTEFVRVPVSCPSDVTLGTQPVAMAFLAGSGDPAPSDLKTAAWVPGQPVARILVGPAGSIQLAKGVYTVFVKVTDSPEVPVIAAGRITVT